MLTLDIYANLLENNREKIKTMKIKPRELDSLDYKILDMLKDSHRKLRAFSVYFRVVKSDDDGKYINLTIPKIARKLEYLYIIGKIGKSRKPSGMNLYFATGMN